MYIYLHLFICRINIRTWGHFHLRRQQISQACSWAGVKSSHETLLEAVAGGAFTTY